MNVEQEPVVFRRGGFSPPLSLLIPTFSLQRAPARLTAHLPGTQNALLPLAKQAHRFGCRFMPVYYPRPDARPVSCYALFE